MLHLNIFLLFVAYVSLSQHVAQATVFSCNRTAPCGCSRFNANINARIVGGETAVDHSWGWAVSIRSTGGTNFCGGAILSKDHIITAAHCVDDFFVVSDYPKIVVGKNTLSGSDGQTRSVWRIVIHPRYDAQTFENDIAILFLNTPIDFTDPNVARMCLPDVPSSSQSRYPVVKKSLVAIGWGRTSQGGVASNALLQVTLNTVASNENKCHKSINNDRLQFCAAVAGGGKDTCQGDSGGPLMYYSPGEQVWILAGITSYGRGCALPDYAGVYTRTSAYIQWIESVVGSDAMVTIPQNKSNIFTPSHLIISIIILFLIQSYIYN